MTRVIYDATLKEKLPNLDEPIELCDEEGHVLARIQRVLDPALSDREPRISEEELERRFAEPGKIDPTPNDREPRISMEELKRRRSYKGKTYTTAEVLAYLEQL